MEQKPNKLHLPVWLLIVSLILVLIGGFYVYRRINEPVYFEPISPAPTDIKFNDEWATSSNLKTYENDKYGFSFEYPSDWDIREDSINKKIIILDSAHKVIQHAGGELGLTIMSGNDIYSSFDDMVSKNEKNENTKVVDRALNGKISAKFLKTIEGRSEYLIQSPNKEHFFSVYDNPSNSVDILDFNQILSTFKFIDSVTTTSKIYTNSKYGFSLTFPKSWEKYKIKEANIEGATATYYVNVPTKFPSSTDGNSTDLKDYYSPFALSVYTLAQWKDVVKSDGPQDSLITKNDKYVFTWTHAQWAPEDFKLDSDIAGIIASFKLK
ncbi:MAG: PsbP-related protein [Candidatus Berkelbacteria bacterium]